MDIGPDDDRRLVLQGAARDLRTDDAGGVTVVAAAALTAHLDRFRILTSLTTAPPESPAGALVGLHVGRGFREAVDRVLPDERAASTPLFLLLDELPVATLISGYADLYSGELGPRAAEAQALQADICSGWRTDGTMMVSLRTAGEMPIPLGPVANELAGDDPLGWHDIPTLTVGAMRRQRLVEVAAGDPMSVYAMFRDTHVDETGEPTILHEYSLTATIDRHMVLTRCEARPQVLPWIECPAAAASARALEGCTVGAIRDVVRQRFRGTSTCTHLNDLLRSLGDLAVLAPALASTEPFDGPVVG
jgi:hypothetical protein